MKNPNNKKELTNVEITNELLQQSAELKKKNRETNEKLEKLKAEINKLSSSKDKFTQKFNP